MATGSKIQMLKVISNIIKDIPRYFQFQELTQGSKSTDGASTRTSKKRLLVKTKEIAGQILKKKFLKEEISFRDQTQEKSRDRKVEKSSKKIKQQSKQVQATTTTTQQTSIHTSSICTKTFLKKNIFTTQYISKQEIIYSENM